MSGRVDLAARPSRLAPFVDDVGVAWDARTPGLEPIAQLTPEVALELRDHRDTLGGPVAPTGIAVDLQTFPALRRLARTVLLQRLDHGAGFVVLRGLGALELTPDQMQAAFWRFCVAMGEPMVQKAGHVRFGRVADLGRPASSRPRYHETAVGGSVHTDSPIMPQVADLVGLLCLRAAEQGGQSRFVSVARVHNILLRQAPDLLGELYGLFDFDRRIPADDVSDTNPALLRAPIFSYAPDQGAYGLRLRWQPEYVWEAASLPGASPLSERRRLALHLLEGVLEDRSNAITRQVAMIPGDMQFLNNHRIAHGRAAFFDPPATEGTDGPRREMRRVWLRRRPASKLPVVQEAPCRP